MNGDTQVPETGTRKGTTKQREDWKWLGNLSDGILQKNRKKCEWGVEMIVDGYGE